MIQNVEYLKTVVDSNKLEESISEVAFVGRSNVGKSSLINAICGTKKLANVSQHPGKTRTINVFCIVFGRWLVDLPGYGYAVGPKAEKEKWKKMIEVYLKHRKSLKMVVMIVDAKVGPTNLDKQMLEWLQSNSIPFCIAANKSDKVKPGAHQERIKFIADELELSPDKVYLVSAAKKNGIPQIERTIKDYLGLKK